MNVLIVESRHELSLLWERHLERQGYDVAKVSGQDDAVLHLAKKQADIIAVSYTHLTLPTILLV